MPENLVGGPVSGRFKNVAGASFFAVGGVVPLRIQFRWYCHLGAR